MKEPVNANGYMTLGALVAAIVLSVPAIAQERQQSSRGPFVASVVVFLQAQAPPMPRSDNETGMQFYTRYLAAIRKATRIDEVLAYWGADLVKEFNDAPTSERADLDGIKRFYSMITAVKVVKETSGADDATLTLEGVGRDGKKITGTAYLIKENGAWKLLSQESWN